MIQEPNNDVFHICKHLKSFSSAGILQTVFHHWHWSFDLLIDFNSMSYQYLFIQIQMNVYKEVQFLSLCVPP